MSNLSHWQNIIKEKRKKTKFRDFLKEIVSWDSFILYKNNGIISKYPNTKRIKGVCSSKEFTDDKNLNFNNINYNFSIDFFSNFKNLYSTINFPSLRNIGSENSDYVDTVLFSDNCYLSFTVITNCENILYSLNIKDGSRNVLNSVMVWDNCENIYMSSGIFQSSFIFFSKSILNSSQIWLSQNLIGCRECIFCRDIENQSYCIDNIKYEKNEYFEKKSKILKNKESLINLYSKIVQSSKNIMSQNISGSSNFYSNDIENGLLNYKVQNGRNVVLVGLPRGNINIYDTYNAGSPHGGDMYGVMGAGGENLYSVINNNNGTNNFYCILTDECSFCLGCIGLKNKSYCILNKQYTKEEWYEMVDKIFNQMNEQGILGDFFPGSLNPFYFNDTMASVIDPTFTKEEVEKEGYMWRDDKIKVDIPEGAEIVLSSELDKYQGFIEGEKNHMSSPTGSGIFRDDTNTLARFPLSREGQNMENKGQEKKWHINPDIMKKVIKDENGNVYKIVPLEYDFLMKYGLPLPNIHWLDRIKMGFRF